MSELTSKGYSKFNSFMHKLASSRIGAWYFSLTQHHLDRFFLKLLKRRTPLTTKFTGLPVVILTTIGAKSGKERTTPLLCIRNKANPSSFAVIASNWGKKHHPAWYYNLKANNIVTCSLDGIEAQYEAQETTGEEYQKFWKLAQEVYIGFPKYQDRAGSRHIPIFVLKKGVSPPVHFENPDSQGKS